MNDYENNLNPEEANSSEEKGYVDTEGNEKCQKEKQSQIAFLKERDEKKECARSAYQAYINKVTGYITDHEADCTSGTATSASQWGTCSNTRLEVTEEDG